MFRRVQDRVDAQDHTWKPPGSSLGGCFLSPLGRFQPRGLGEDNRKVSMNEQRNQPSSDHPNQSSQASQASCLSPGILVSFGIVNVSSSIERGRLFPYYLIKIKVFVPSPLPSHGAMTPSSIVPQARSCPDQAQSDPCHSHSAAPRPPAPDSYSVHSTAAGCLGQFRLG